MKKKQSKAERVKNGNPFFSKFLTSLHITICDFLHLKTPEFSTQTRISALNKGGNFIMKKIRVTCPEPVEGIRVHPWLIFLCPFAP
ncbi:MAG: hypothetical protein WC476_02015 [Phycisphaerae bacterium]